METAMNNKATHLGAPLLALLGVLLWTLIPVTAAETRQTMGHIGVARSVTGPARIERTTGASAPLKAGDLVAARDKIETGAGGTVGIVLIDGAVIALGERSELLVQTFAFDRAAKTGGASIALVAGAAMVASGAVAGSGPDALLFKLPVATVALHGTKVFASYDPVNGEAAVLHRPPAAPGGKIVLSLPDQTLVGSINAPGRGWQWTPVRGERPRETAFSDVQAQSLIGALESTLNALLQK